MSVGIDRHSSGFGVDKLPARACLVVGSRGHFLTGPEGGFLKNVVFEFAERAFSRLFLKLSFFAEIAIFSGTELPCQKI